LTLIPRPDALGFLRSLFNISSAEVASWSRSLVLGNRMGDVDAECQYPSGGPGYGGCCGPYAGDGSVETEDAYEDEGRAERGSKAGEVWEDGGYLKGFIGVWVAEKAGVVVVDSVLPISRSSSDPPLSSSSSPTRAQEVFSGGGAPRCAGAGMAPVPFAFWAACRSVTHRSR
jgi:hypothetical protein